MTEVIDDVSDHVLSVRGSYLLTRMKYITHVLGRYYMHHVTLFFFFFFFPGLLACFEIFLQHHFIL